MTSTVAPPQNTPVRAADLLDILDATGHSAYVGVPCSLLSPLYNGLAARGNRIYAATREDLGIGVAAGFVLAGRRPAVLMQNSGLAGSVGALLSLPRMYRLAMTLIVSWRGHGPDAPEHVELGANMADLLAAAGLRWLPATAPAAELASLTTADAPVAILVRPGDLR